MNYKRRITINFLPFVEEIEIIRMSILREIALL